MNNNYLKRHAENLESARVLIHTHSHYCSSVHCSYYAVFQYLLHFHKIKDTRVFKNRNRLDSLGSHDLIISETFTYFRNVDEKRARHFSQKIKMLKSARVTADYQEAYIDKTFSIVAYETAQNLVNLISEMIHI